MPTFGELLLEARRLFSAGQSADAEAIYQRLIQAVPQAADPWHELGLVQMKAEHFEVAAQYVQKAIALDPGVPAYHSNLGAAYQKLERFADALSAFERALQLAGPTPELCNNLALALKGLGRKDEALAAFDEALSLRGDYANGHYNRGTLLMTLGRVEEAVADFRRALALSPDDYEVLMSLGVACFITARADEALACFERARALEPAKPDPRRNRALAWLQMGDYARGWPEFEYRLECDDCRTRATDRPRWRGEPLAGRRLLIHAEQGLGDTLQFVRYARLVEPLAADFTIEVQTQLMGILAASGLGRWLVPRGGTVEHDVHCPMLSLPVTLPDHDRRPYWGGPYLAADERRVALWKARLEAIDGFRVGIVWSGSTEYAHNNLRSVALAEFAPVAQIPGVRLISLQKGPPRDEIATLPGEMPLVDFGEELDETGGAFMDTAAIIRNLDLVVTVDTAIAHLAGGMGAPVWLALQLAPDWRWTLGGETTPWYPGMRLFRQRRLGDWSEVVAGMADALRMKRAGSG